MDSALVSAARPTTPTLMVTANPGDTLMEFIEVQYGENLDENDIVRIEDDYGRS